MNHNISFKEYFASNLSVFDGVEELESAIFSTYNAPKRTLIYSNSIDLIKDYSNLVCINIWSTGGIHGSCYSDAMYRSEGEPKPEFTELDGYIEAFNPNITFMQYRKHVLPLIKTGTYSVGEYYGGSSSYGYEYVHLEELWNALRAL